MKSILLTVLFIVPFTLATLAGDDEEKAALKVLVNQWNELHNTKNINGFYEIYDPTVLFYGKQTSRLNCVDTKSRGLLKREFSQEIISPIEVSHYSSGIIKAEYRKKVTTTKRINEHDCYLLFENKNGKYLIVGESDLGTDSYSGFVLNIGNKINEQSGSAPKTLLIGGMALVVGGILYYFKRKRKTGIYSEFENKVAPVTGTAVPVYSNIISEQLKQEEPANLVLSDGEKGQAFEKWVVERFDKQYFDLLEWRGDKIHDGRFALSNMHPDMEFKFKGKKIVEFAVECKWRKDLFKNKIEWAKDHQLRNYRTFEKKERKKVFVVIGIGGEPGNPENIHIIPLSKIYSTKLSADQLDRSKRYNKGKLFFNPFALELS